MKRSNSYRFKTWITKYRWLKFNKIYRRFKRSSILWQYSKTTITNLFGLSSKILGINMSGH